MIPSAVVSSQQTVRSSLLVVLVGAVARFFYAVRIAFLTCTRSIEKHENGSHFVIRMRLGNHLIQLPSRAAAFGRVFAAHWRIMWPALWML